MMCCATGRRWSGGHLPLATKTHDLATGQSERVVVPDWESSATCLSAGLCVGMVPSHFARPWIDRGEWTALALENPFPDAACCLTGSRATRHRRCRGYWIIWGQ